MEGMNGGLKIDEKNRMEGANDCLASLWSMDEMNGGTKGGMKGGDDRRGDGKRGDEKEDRFEYEVWEVCPVCVHPCEEGGIF